MNIQSKGRFRIGHVKGWIAITRWAHKSKWILNVWWVDQDTGRYHLPRTFFQRC